MSLLYVITVACFMVSCHINFVLGGNQRNEEVELYDIHTPPHWESGGMLTEDCTACCVCVHPLGPSLGPHWHNESVTHLFTLRYTIYLEVAGRGLSLKVRRFLYKRMKLCTVCSSSLHFVKT